MLAVGIYRTVHLYKLQVSCVMKQLYLFVFCKYLLQCIFT